MMLRHAMLAGLALLIGGTEAMARERTQGRVPQTETVETEAALSERLERLQAALQDLVLFLDAERLYVGQSGWLTAT